MHDEEWRAILAFIGIMCCMVLVVLCLNWIFIGICNLLIDCQLIYNKIGDIIR